MQYTTTVALGGKTSSRVVEAGSEAEAAFNAGAHAQTSYYKALAMVKNAGGPDNLVAELMAHIGQPSFVSVEVVK